MVIEKGGDGLGVGDVAIHAHGQGFDAGDGVKRIGRRHGRAEIAQRHRPGLHGKAEISECFMEGQPVVGGVGFGHGRELAVFRPVEFSRFD